MKRPITTTTFTDLELSIVIEAVSRQWETGKLVPEEGYAPWDNEDVSNMLKRLHIARGRLREGIMEVTK